MHDILIYTLNLLVGVILGYLSRRIMKINVENNAIRAGMQAMLRDRMIESYNIYYCDKGYCPIYAKESFQNVYRAYHNLGVNGVMDDIREKVMALPTEGEDGRSC